MKWIDDLLNSVTMYRVVLYYLIALLVAAGALGVFHVLPYSPIDIAYSVGVLLLSSFAANILFARVWRAVPGSASLFITALILALIVTPVAPTDINGALFLAFLGVWSMASKYFIAYRGKHLFNPAAFAVALGSIVALHGATWWVAGNLPLLPLVLVGGLLIVRKIQRFDLVLSFTAAALLTVGLTSNNPFHSIETTVLHSSLLFLAFVMLTEPATMPPTRSLRIAYGALVGIWFAPAMHIGSFYFSPEFALLLGNIFVFLVAPKGRFMLTLREKNQLAKDTYEFVFTPEKHHAFLPGQYLEWTLPEGGRSDNRGNRRYFTIASSPTESFVRLALRTSTPSSAFKEKILALPLGATMTASGLAGDFTLPNDDQRKVAFIAGGIGITPFRSMIGQMVDTKAKRDTVLLYSNKTVEEVAYHDVFEAAQKRIPLRTIYALTSDTRTFPGAHTGMIDVSLIKKEVPDYLERTFYLSGPRSMVVAFTKTLRELGVAASHIHTDYFPGFA